MNMAVLIVSGINKYGIHRGILAVEPMYSESEDTYTALFKQLKARRLQQAWLFVSDAHLGIQAAVKKCFQGSTWQRCKVHLMRNILAHVNHRDKKQVAEKMKQIWNQPTKDDALQMAQFFIDEFEQIYPEAVKILENGLGDLLQFYEFESFAARRISLTNMQKRIHKEIRRRTRVVGIFPSVDSYVRPMTCYLIEYSEDWSTSRAYISEQAIAEYEIKMRKAA